MTFEEKLKAKAKRQQLGVDAYTSYFIMLDDALSICQAEIESACRKQREEAKFMANDMQAIAMRYNTVVSFEAIDIEFQKIFDRYFTPSPKGEGK